MRALKEFTALHEGWVAVNSVYPVTGWEVGSRNLALLFSSVPGYEVECEKKLLTYLACYENNGEQVYIFQGKENYIFWVYNTPPNTTRVTAFEGSVYKEYQAMRRRERETPNLVREPHRALQRVEEEPPQGYYKKWRFNKFGKIL